MTGHAAQLGLLCEWWDMPRSSLIEFYAPVKKTVKMRSTGPSLQKQVMRAAHGRYVFLCTYSCSTKGWWKICLRIVLYVQLVEDMFFEPAKTANT